MYSSLRFNNYNGQSDVSDISTYFQFFWTILKQLLDIKELYL